MRHPQDSELDYQRVGDIAAGGPEEWNKNIQTYLDKNFQIVRHQDSIPLVLVSPVLWLNTQNNCCEAQGKGRANGRPRKVTQRSFIDYGWWMVDILSLMLYIKWLIGCHHHPLQVS